MSIVNEEPKRPASSVDYSEWLEDFIPPERRPYILARLALANYGQLTVFFEQLSEEAFLDLKQSNDSGTLKPPLSETLEKEIGYIVDDLERPDRAERGRSIAATEAAALLLAWAVDHGNVEHRHDSSEGLIG